MICLIEPKIKWLEVFRSIWPIDTFHGYEENSYGNLSINFRRKKIITS